MKILKNTPFWVSVYITVVGVSCGLIPILQITDFEFKAPNKYFLLGIAVVFIASGVRYTYLSLAGKLEPRGLSVADVRKEALEKIESEAYLAKAAKDDPDPEVREKALERLKEITA